MMFGERFFPSHTSYSRVGGTKSYRNLDSVLWQPMARRQSVRFSLLPATTNRAALKPPLPTFASSLWRQCLLGLTYSVERPCPPDDKEICIGVDGAG